jgi:hypothetical protein
VGFSVRVAPGVRVRASSRGVRTSLGPRVARVHVGAGRPGVSTGVGPVGYYTSIGGSRRPQSARRAAPVTSGSGGPTAAQQKAAQAEELRAALQAILDLPKATFPPVARPAAPEPPDVDEAAVRRHFEAAARQRTSVFARSERKAALSEARTLASAEVARLHRSYQAARAQWQAELDKQWASLRSNDPETVLGMLAQAFEDNEAPAAPVGIEGDTVSLAVIVPPPDVVPERKPGTTPAGNLSLKKLTKRESADFYKLVVSGHVLATLKECFAVAPAVRAAKVVAIRRGAPDAYGECAAEVVTAARVERERLERVRWDSADAATILNDASTELLVEQKGAAKELQPLELASHPDVAHVVEVIDFDDFTAKGGQRS